MALTKTTAEIFVNWVTKYDITGSCLQLGRQDVMIDRPGLIDILKKLEENNVKPAEDIKKLRNQFYNILKFDYAYADKPDFKVHGYLSERCFFELFGFKDRKSLDASDFEGADYVYDMNRDDIDTVIEEPFDMLMETGTAEHVFHFPNYCKNIFKSLNPGGYAMIFSPVNNFVDHGFYQFSPTLYFDYYNANRFSILEYLILDTDTDDWSTVNANPYQPGAWDSTDRNRFSGRYVSTAILVRKEKDSTCDVIPNRECIRIMTHGLQDSLTDRNNHNAVSIIKTHP